MSSLGVANVTRNESPDPSSHASNVYDIEDPGDAQGQRLEEEDDDDMDFQTTTTDDSEDVDFFETTEGDFDFQGIDADDGLNSAELDFTANDSEQREEDNIERETETPNAQPGNTGYTSAGRLQVTHSQIMQLFGHAGLRDLFTTHRGSGIIVDEDDEVDDGYGGTRRRRRAQDRRGQYPPVPSVEGKKLMASGTFGENLHFEDKIRKRKDRLALRLMYRELGTHVSARNRTDRLMSQRLIPSSNADTIIHYNARCYSGQFSDDGNFFFSCAQDFKVRMYDTSNPYKWKYYKTAIYPYGQWTITDASLSPDNKYLAYSSIRSIIWSIRFSGDGREVVAGTSDHSVYVYDIETKRSILRIPGHTEDVNAVCFGDNSSPHVLYSGSDDTLIKVWDRRSMGDSREAGVFMGHTEGLTYVDSKGDGRYVLSNGKDQTMKLWDLRKMMPTEKASRVDPARYSTGFDYRFLQYPDAEYEPHPHDCSLVTFRGHRVLKTLIRCHFSPPGSTDSRYVYSGSEDGSVYVYNMDATLAGKIDVNKATHHSRPKDPDFYTHSYEMRTNRNPDAWKTCVRDASWHPNAPVVAATSWNGWGMSTGTCTTHSWNDGAEDDEGEPRMGLRVNQRLEEDEDLYDHPRRGNRQSQFRSRLRSQIVRATEDDDEEAW
ncbi:MAG: hypothetical protein Q9174_001159 [Haloplaca sp. 1 TL-2023]